MVGTILNVVGILVGGITGMIRTTPMAASTQGLMKLFLGLATVVCGFWLIWRGMADYSFGGMVLLIENRR